MNPEQLKEWTEKKAKLEVVEKIIAFLGYEYQKLGGKIFSDYVFESQTSSVQNSLEFLDRLSTDGILGDPTKEVSLLRGHAQFLKELQEVRDELIEMIEKLSPETHKESPVPTVNS